MRHFQCCQFENFTYMKLYIMLAKRKSFSCNSLVFCLFTKKNRLLGDFQLLMICSVIILQTDIDRLIQCSFNAGPASKTVAQH